jgi:hypothetical protein
MWQTSVVVNYLQTFFHQPSPKSKLLHFRLHIFISSGPLGQSALCFHNNFAFRLPKKLTEKKMDLIGKTTRAMVVKAAGKQEITLGKQVSLPQPRSCDRRFPRTVFIATHSTDSSLARKQ